MTPNQVNEDNEHIVFENLYPVAKKTKSKPYAYKIGQKVRISGNKHVFRREHFERWSREIFTIHSRKRMDDINMYRISDCTGTVVENSFYEQELTKVEGDPSTLHRIESILDEKTENGVKKVLVHWQGTPRACADWILKSSLRRI